jgi:predicted RNA methylase
LAKVDAPSSRRAAQIFCSLPVKSREELCRPILKSYYVYFDTQIDPEEFPLKCLADESVRVRKSACQATGTSWQNIQPMYREVLAEEMISLLSKARDSSEIKALTEALGKSGYKKAFAALSEASEETAVNPQVLLKAKRDHERVDTSNDYCLPEEFGVTDFVVWFTSGVDRIAQMREPFLKADRLDDGILGVSDINWSQLWSHYLWRDAGLVIAESDEWSPRSLAEKVSNSAAMLKRATRRNSEDAPVRLRLGRSDGRGRSFVWDFALELDRLSTEVINDGRSAHWELRFIDRYLVLVPILFAQERFPWRDVEVDGASDPTVAAALVYLAGIKSGESVLDPFCGGATELVFAGLLRTGAKLCGIDIDREVLRDGQEALARADVLAQLRCGDALKLGDEVFDVIVTNPPFGMRTVRGQARDLLQDFLGGVRKNLSKNGRVVLLSHAPKSSRDWAQAGGMKLTRSFPLKLGKMGCEIQVFSPQGLSN